VRVKIAEPGTVLTDWLLAAFTAWLAWTLFRQVYRLKDRAANLWLAAFCAVAASAFLGGTWHGFSAQIDPSLAAVLWAATMLLASAGSLLFLLAALHVYTSGRLLDILSGIAVTKFVLFALLVAINDNFRIVVYDSALAMFALVVLGTWGAWVRQVPSAPWMLAGVLVSMLAALFQQGRVSIHAHFNHNDLYHVIQMGAMYFLFRGGLLVREQEPPARDVEATQPLPMVREE
jgi:hypothetical protein